jgi:hypothetical protein
MLFGDVAQKTGDHGHQSRHKEVLDTLAAVAKDVVGALAEREPPYYRGYSSYRLDISFAEGALEAGAPRLLGDVKLFDPLGGEPAQVERHGVLARVADTLPVAKRKMFGLAANKDDRAATFNRSTGIGSWPRPSLATTTLQSAVGVRCSRFFLRPLGVSRRG